MHTNLPLVQIDTLNIKQLIKNKLNCQHIEINSADNVHFQAIIVSADFTGLNLVKRHRLVYNTINAEINSGLIHALSFQTLTPQEFEKLS